MQTVKRIEPPNVNWIRKRRPGAVNQRLCARPGRQERDERKRESGYSHRLNLALLWQADVTRA